MRYVRNLRTVFLWSWIHLDEELLLRWAIVFAVGIAIGFSAASREFLPDMITTALIGGILGSIALYLTGRIRIWLLAYMIFEAAVSVDIFLGWRRDVGALGTLAGFNISLTTFCLIGLYGIWLLESIVLRERPRLSPSLRAGVPLIFYVAITGLSMLWATDGILSIYLFNVVAQLYLLFIYIAGTVRSEGDFTILALAQSVTVFYIAWVAIMQRFTAGSLYMADQTAGIYVYRVSGPFGSPNSGGGYLAVTLFFLAGMLFTPIRKSLKIFIGSALAAGVFAIILMQSRGSWVGFSVGGILFFAALFFWGKLSIRTITIIVTIFAIVVVVIGGTVSERFTEDDNGAAASRGPLMQLALNMVADYPFLGVGGNNYATIMPEYTGPEFSRSWLYTVHNTYLLVWSELGTVGLIAFLSFLLTTLYRGWKNWQAQHPFFAPVSLGLTAGITGIMIHFFVDVFRGRGASQALMISAALISAVYLFHTSSAPIQERNTSQEAARQCFRAFTTDTP